MFDKQTLQELKGKNVTHPSYGEQVGRVIETAMIDTIYAGPVPMAVVQWSRTGEVDRVRADLLTVAS